MGDHPGEGLYMYCIHYYISGATLKNIHAPLPLPLPILRSDGTRLPFRLFIFAEFLHLRARQGTYSCPSLHTHTPRLPISLTEEDSPTIFFTSVFSGTAPPEPLTRCANASRIWLQTWKILKNRYSHLMVSRNSANCFKESCYFNYLAKNSPYRLKRRVNTYVSE